MTRVGVISDEFWEIVEPVIPTDVGKRGRRFAEHRRILEGITYRFRTGCPWRDLPEDFGPWQTVWKRHHRWSFDGTYDEMLAAVAQVFGLDLEELDGDIGAVLSIDSTSVRAHQHAAGARADTLTGGLVELQEIRRRAH